MATKSRTTSIGSDYGLIPALFPTRPEHIVNKCGESGRRIECVANYIPIQTYPDWTLLQYHVSFTPVIDSKGYRNDIIRDPKFIDVFGKNYIFDGMILYSPNRLHESQFELESSHPRTGERIQIKVKLTNEFAIDNQQCLTIFNLCNRKSFECLGYRQMGRHFYNPNRASQIEKHKLEIWPGMISAIRAYEDKLLLCCEMSHKLLRKETVQTFLRELMNHHSVQNFQQKAIQMLVGSSVLTRYNNKTYRVDDIMWNKHPVDKFQLADGTEQTYVDYYLKQYDIKIQDPDQPMLLSRSKNRGGLGSLAGLGGTSDIYLIPELCSMTGLTDELREDRQVMQELARFTRVEPSARVQLCRNYVQDIQKNEKARSIFETWNLKLGDDLLKVRARVLPQETLIFGKQQRVTYNSVSADWSRECRSKPLTSVVSLDYWIMVFHKNDCAAAEEIFKEIKFQGPPIGVMVEDPYIIKLNTDSVGDYLNGIQSGLADLPKARIVVVVVPNDNKTRYDAIKKHCCLDCPIPSQVVKANSVSKNTRSVCSKILLQMNCKLGGSLWRVDVPLRNFMIIGYDAYHDSANKGQSVGAAVFSMEPTLTRWWSRCALHSDPNQLVTNLTEFCRDGIEKYHETTGMYPEKIFLFRDGVGDGQIPTVYKDELPRVRKAFQDIPDANVTLAFIIVTKRVNTRYFEQVGSNYRNPPPGTVVDNGVTKPERYDFYLVPQSVRQGTVTPVSYNVIYDDTNLQPDHMQRLAYKLCHLYYNWQGTIRVPAPCQYAHKLAFLVAQSLHKPVDKRLADKLFFL